MYSQKVTSPLPRRQEYLAFGKPNFSDEEIAAVSRVMRSGWVGMGPETIAFETELAQALGAREVVTVNSCTSALFLSLVVNGIGPGDEVITPSLTWCSTANAALYLGATPVFCDVDTKSHCVTPQTITAKLTARTKAVIAVHMGGLSADIEAIRSVLPEHVVLIEDAAHALGSRYRSGPSVGSSGNLVCFSFYANKNLSTGEGGAIALTDTRTADRLRSLRQHGLAADAWKRFSHPQTALVPGVEELGYKMNYTDLQASIGRVQLRRQPEFLAHRRALADRYAAGLAAARIPIEFQSGVFEMGHALHLLIVQLPIEGMTRTRDEILLALRDRNVGASIHYAPLHSMPFYAKLCQNPGLPVTEFLASRMMTLPISASMTIDDVDYVVENLIEVFH